jgi:hypothetical protein
MGWATAWSFDRLRLWLERGVDPATTMRRAAAHGIARAAIGGVLLYHAVVRALVLGSVLVTVAIAALLLASLLTVTDLPSARRCLRAPPEGDS